MAIREVETTCSASILEVEGDHATRVREVEAACMTHAFDLQWTHKDDMQTLESEAIKEEGRAHQSFLQASGIALQACPAEALGVLMYPIHLLMGNMSLTTLLMTAPQLTIGPRDLIPSPPHSERPHMAVGFTGIKQHHCSPKSEVELVQSRDEEPMSHPEELPQ